MDTRKGGSRYCPPCKKIVETRVILEGYCQEEIYGILAKKRQIICGTDAERSGGCGTKWFTLEILEGQVPQFRRKIRLNKYEKGVLGFR